MRRLQAALAAAALVGAAPVEGGPGGVDCTVSPVMRHGALESVRVVARFQADASGRTVVDLPDHFAGTDRLWRFVRDVRANGATIAETAHGPKLTLASAPAATVTLNYRVVSAYDADPKASGNPYDGPILRPAWFSAMGNQLLIAPEHREHAPARVAYTGWPAAWTVVSDMDNASASDDPPSLDDAMESMVLGGPDVRLRERAIPGGTLRFAVRGIWPFDLDGYADTMARIVTAERGEWGDTRGPFTVTLLPLTTVPDHFSSGGTGRFHGFAQYADGGVPREMLVYNIAHEHSHAWIPRRIGEMPDVDEAADYWLSEGFTDWFAARSMLRAGLWSRAKFMKVLNARLNEYAVSPARAYPNARIVKDFWTDRAVEQLPYRRGELFAYMLDRALRGRGGLDGVLFEMRDRWAAALADKKPLLVPNLVAALDRAGVDARSLISDHIERGMPILLAADTFAGCATVRTLTIPAFDPGFDREASAKAGVFTGVDHHGPAYAAGLRDGMRHLARVSGTEGDSRAVLAYRVVDRAGERTIGWRPGGKGSIMLQEVTNLPQAAPAVEAQCTQTMSGGVM